MDAKDVDEGPCDEGINKGNVAIDVKDVSEAPHAKLLWRQVVVPTKDINEGMLSY
jgi:hypothetical protein